MFGTILVPLDGSALAEQALDVAVAVARACNASIELVLAYPLATIARDVDTYDRIAGSANRYLLRIAGELARSTGLSVKASVEAGDAETVICDRARQTDGVLIVMTSHGRTGVSRAWLGSVADGVIRRSSVPVLLARADVAPSVRAHATPPLRRILVPLDGSTTSSAIVDSAATLARAVGGTLILARVAEPVPIYVFDPTIPAYATPAVDDDATNQVVDEVRQDLAGVAQGIEREYDLRLETAVAVSKYVGPALLELAIEMRADLIAMTTHSRGSSRLLIGSVADKLLRGSRLPLLVIHPTAAATAAPPSSAPAGRSVPNTAHRA